MENELQMADTVHKCLFCESVAYEVEPNEFMCSNDECPWTWKVIDCES